MTDWLSILKDQQRISVEMQSEVPQMLGNPDIEAAQVKTLFQALEKQAEFAEQLKSALETLGHDFAVVDAADRLVDRYVELAASAGEKLKALRT